MRVSSSIVVGVLAATFGVVAPAIGKGNPMVVISTSAGDIKVELYADKAPTTVQNFLDYAKAGYYDGTIFHRVIPSFMIQGGGITADMKDKPGQKPPIKNESSNGLKNESGTLAMARTSAPDSATSQFFINVADNAFLDKEKAADKVGYAVFGKVVEGMDVVKKIGATKTSKPGDRPVKPITIQSVTIEKK
jgi:peptidyl-prolyl cis-trans isomerase A (cyclophilin A)